jgi:hypothetical protein
MGQKQIKGTAAGVYKWGLRNQEVALSTIMMWKQLFMHWWECKGLIAAVGKCLNSCQDKSSAWKLHYKSDIAAEYMSYI